jgi:hypothetical protein
VSRICRVISARLRSRTARSTEGRSGPVWLMSQIMPRGYEQPPLLRAVFLTAIGSRASLVVWEAAR